MLESITANVADLDKYWSEQDFKKNPQLKMAATFWTSFDVQNELPIPLLLHGDHASFSETDSMLVVSMRCVISDKAVKNSELLLACLPKEATTGSTWKPIWDAITASLTALANGRHPDRSRPLRRAIVMAVAGDLEFFAAEFGWPTASSNYPCPFCKADNFFNEDKKVAPFNDFRPTAAWRALPRTPPNNGHQLLSVPAVNCWSLKLDLLHMVDLGCSVSCQVK